MGFAIYFKGRKSDALDDSRFIKPD